MRFLTISITVVAASQPTEAASNTPETTSTAITAVSQGGVSLITRELEEYLFIPFEVTV